MLWRKKINDCAACGGTGHMPTPREPSEAPLYGDDTISCPHCRGEPSATHPTKPTAGPPALSSPVEDAIEPFKEGALAMRERAADIAKQSQRDCFCVGKDEPCAACMEAARIEGAIRGTPLPLPLPRG